MEGKTTREVQAALAKPFAPEDLEWRLQNTNKEKTRGMAVSIHDGVAWLPSGDAFAGSVATMDRLVRNMVTLADVPLYEAVKMASATPAKIIGQRKKGILAPGMDADMVVLDQTLHVTDTIIGGDSIR